MKDLTYYTIIAIIFGLCLYFSVALTVFAFQNPELTDIQRLIHFWDAITFQ